MSLNSQAATIDAPTRVQVLVPAAVDAAFTYRTDDAFPPGTLVEASFAGRTLVGAVWDGVADAAVPEAKLKPISRALDFPPLSTELMKFIDAVAAFTLAPKGAVLSLCGLAHAVKDVKKPYVSPVYAPNLPVLSVEQQAAAEQISSPFRGEVGWGPVQGKTFPLAHSVTNAKQLRKDMTDAEHMLWEHLRREALGVKFRKQHPVGKYIADFVCLDPQLIIELDGGEHNEFAAAQYDQERTKFLQARGFQVLRFWNNEVLENIEGVVEVIKAKVGELQRPLPNPPPKGEGTTERAAVPKPILLDGVTGSGKTEVYFHAIADALKHSPESQILVMLPEIALTHQWVERFTKTFGAAPVMWHSHLTPAQRRKAWQAIARGDARVIVGARSALFLPFKKLSLIVVDEEHDPSYKQEDGVLYHARDMAVLRARLAGVPIILSSATPSLETLLNVQAGKYTQVHLPQRFGAATLPDVAIVDMQHNPPERGEFLSPVVKQAIVQTLARGEQVLLFLNRRGYAPLLLCRHCGHRFQCENCSAWMVVHGKKQLRCHHCDTRKPVPLTCPSCNESHEQFAACGPGVERVMEEARGMFGVVSRQSSVVSEENPNDSQLATHDFVPRLALLSSDESIDPDTWEQITKGEIDIIVGTQMVAKGHHFPRLTLVVVVDADMSLEGADLRAGERAYQLLHQLGGRAGRDAAAGQVLIQTYQPQHPIMQALTRHDRDAVMQMEMRIREAGHWPPYGQLAAVLLDGADEAKVRAAGQLLAQSAPQDARMTVLGPAPAPLSKLRGQYRYRLLVKADKTIHLQRTLSAWIKGQKFPGVRVKLDVNPYYFL